MNLCRVYAAAETASMNSGVNTTQATSLDPLTGLGDHDKLIADLERALDPGNPPAVVAVFELVGWHDYRRSSGELASDELIARCAIEFARAIGPAGVPYRSRQDELTALISRPIDEASSILLGAQERLQSEGESSRVTACFGTAVLPDEAADPIELLILADQRIRLRVGVPKPRERRHSTSAAGPPMRHGRGSGEHG
jgi:GGDEF domain-containing protein